MKKIHIVGLALAAVFVFSAFSVASAFALESGWLVNGAGALSEVLVKTIGLLFLDVLVAGILAVQLDCEGILDGTVGSATSIAADLITEILTSTGGPAPLSCKVESSLLKACGSVGELASVTAVGLPWVTKIVLSGGAYLVEFPPNSGYKAVCPGGKENTCSGKAVFATLSNGTNDVNGVFTEAENEAPCTEGVGHIGGEGLTETISGESLAVSEGE